MKLKYSKSLYKQTKQQQHQQQRIFEDSRISKASRIF